MHHYRTSDYPFALIDLTNKVNSGAKGLEGALNGAIGGFDFGYRQHSAELGSLCGMGNAPSIQ